MSKIYKRAPLPSVLTSIEKGFYQNPDSLKNFDNNSYKTVSNELIYKDNASDEPDSNSWFSPRVEESQSETPRSYIALHSRAIEFTRNRCNEIGTSADSDFDIKIPRNVRNFPNAPRRPSRSIDLSTNSTKRAPPAQSLNIVTGFDSSETPDLRYDHNVNLRRSVQFDNVGLRLAVESSNTDELRKSSQNIVKLPDDSENAVDSWAFKSTRSPRHSPRRKVEIASGKQTVSFSGKPQKPVQ